MEKELNKIATELSRINDKLEKLIGALKVSRDLIIEQANEQVKIGSCGTYGDDEKPGERK